MQHQKAKHFKCNMCPRRLNTAGGLAVHIQQVHKLEPEKCVVFHMITIVIHTPLDSLPRIENALPGRDGYEVEIFGMEGIPAPDVADYKRRKEIELGLSAGSISQPPPKRAKVENRPLSEDELRRQLAEHKALMGLSAPETSAVTESSSGAVYGAPQTYATPPQMPPPMSGGMPPMPPPGMFPPGMPPPGAFPPGGFPPFVPNFPPGYVSFSGLNFPSHKLIICSGPPPGFPMPGFPPGAPPFPPGPPGALGRPPFPPPPGFAPPGMGLPGAPGAPGTPAFSPPPPPQFVPAQIQQNAPAPPPGNANQLPPPPQRQSQQQPQQAQQAPAHIEPAEERVRQPVLTLPDPSRSQTNAEFKKPTDLKFKDPNFSPVCIFINFLGV